MPRIKYVDDLLPIGKRVFAVVAAEDHDAATGTPCMRVTFVGADDDAVQRTIRQIFPLDGRGVGFALPLLRACGVVFPDAKEFTLDFDYADMIGRRVIANLTHEVYDGRKRERLSNFAPATSG